MRITLYSCDGYPVFAFTRREAMETFRTLHGYQAHSVKPWTDARKAEASK